MKYFHNNLIYILEPEHLKANRRFLKEKIKKLEKFLDANRLDLSVEVEINTTAILVINNFIINLIKTLLTEWTIYCVNKNYQDSKNEIYLDMNLIKKYYTFNAPEMLNMVQNQKNNLETTCIEENLPEDIYYMRDFEKMVDILRQYSNYVNIVQQLLLQETPHFANNKVMAILPENLYFDFKLAFSKIMQKDDK